MENRFNEVIDRMQEAGRLRNMSALARDLNITPQALSNYKKRGEMPTHLVVRFALAHGLSIDWLLFGRGVGPAAESTSAVNPSFPHLSPEERVCVNKALRIIRGSEPLSLSFRRTLDMFVEVQEEAEATRL